MQYFQVTITCIIPIEDGDPSPENWPWTPKEEMLAQIDEHLLAIDVRFDPLLPGLLGRESLVAAISEFEAVHANDWHKHEGGCACLE